RAAPPLPAAPGRSPGCGRRDRPQVEPASFILSHVYSAGGGVTALAGHPAFRAPARSPRPASAPLPPPILARSFLPPLRLAATGTVRRSIPYGPWAGEGRRRCPAGRALPRGSVPPRCTRHAPRPVARAVPARTTRPPGLPGPGRGPAPPGNAT